MSNVELNRSQNATGSQKHRGTRFPPYAFTEHGVCKDPPKPETDLFKDMRKALDASAKGRAP